MEQSCATCPNHFVYTTPSPPPYGVIQQVEFSQMLAQNSTTKRKSGADLGYVYTGVVIGLVSVIQQTPSLGNIIPQTFRECKPTWKLQDIPSIYLISITVTSNCIKLSLVNLISKFKFYQNIKTTFLAHSIYSFSNCT